MEHELKEANRLEELADKRDMRKIGEHERDDKNLQSKENEHVGQTLSSMEEELKESEELVGKSDMKKIDGQKRDNNNNVQNKDKEQVPTDESDDEYPIDYAAIVRKRREEQKKNKVCVDEFFQIYK